MLTQDWKEMYPDPKEQEDKFNWPIFIGGVGTGVLLLLLIEVGLVWVTQGHIPV